MKLPRARFTVRWLMVVVIAIAALLSAFEAGRRWERSLHSTRWLIHDGSMPPGQMPVGPIRSVEK